MYAIAARAMSKHARNRRAFARRSGPIRITPLRKGVANRFYVTALALILHDPPRPVNFCHAAHPGGFIRLCP